MIKVRQRRLVLGLCLISIWQVGCATCKKFVKYEDSKFTVSGAKVPIGSGKVVEVASFIVDPQYRPITVEIERLDYQQYQICSTLKSMPAGSEKTKLQADYIRSLLKINEIGADPAAASKKVQESLGPGIVQFWEGNRYTQNLVCQLSVARGFRADFKNKGQRCANDEARSISLLNVRAGAVIRMFDNPDGKRSDDWVEIKTLRRVDNFCLESLERTHSNADVQVVFHRHNGLDGKVSRLEIE